MAGQIYDVAVIGGGVVGCAIARDLAQYDLSIALIEAKSDVGKGTSKANTAILHTGFDGKPDYLESKLVRRGYERLMEYGSQVGIPIEPLGALLVAWDKTQLETLPQLRDNAHANGVTDVEIVSAEDVYRREPQLGKGALGGLIVPGESIICPFTTPLAYATQAVINGVALHLNAPVSDISHVDDHITLHCPDQTIHTRYVINAAGLYSDVINQLMGHHDFTVTPRRGELIVYDKLSRSLVNHILLPVPTKITKGVLISPTVFGNVMLGPTADDIQDKTATLTTEDGIRMLLDKGETILPQLLNEEVTATYSGLRAATEHGDYQIQVYPDENYICVGGIRSTGLSASLGIAEYVCQQLEAIGLALQPKASYQSIKMPNIGEAFSRPFQQNDRIKVTPAYGDIVCFCERVTRGEVRDAYQSPIPPSDLDGLRRRTRVQMGRCQGFYCSGHVKALMDKYRKEGQYTND